MTNKELCNFLVARAEDKGRESNLKDATLSICKNGNNLYLAMQFKTNARPFLLRFIKGNMRAVFKLVSIDPEFESFKSKVNAMMLSRHTQVLPYDDVELPSCLKNKVSATLVQAFKAKGMGMDMISPASPMGINIVKPEESYEEIAIENDLNSYMSCDIFAL